MYRGAGVIVFDQLVTFINNTICDNITSVEPGTFGAGLCVFFGTGEAVGVNNIIYGNVAADEPDCSGNVNFTYSCSGNDIPGTGNISEDPLLVDPENFDYNLLFGSPCIDAGDPDSPQDPDGTRADMGAFFFDQGTSVGDDPALEIPDKFGLLTSYPNPFNPVTTIGFTLQKSADVKLKVYDLKGNLVTELLQGQMPEGRHEVMFQAAGITSGIYLARLTTAELTQSLKLILMK
jgi:hypothetical protein